MSDKPTVGRITFSPELDDAAKASRELGLAGSGVVLGPLFAAGYNAAASEIAALKEERDRLAAELEARDSTDLCVRLMKANNELSDQVVDLQSELSAARADAERVEYCVRNALALDFAYGEEGRCAVVIEIPKDARYSIGFRDIIDTARAASSAEGN